MTLDESRGQDAPYPLWRLTDWAPRQRSAAIIGLLLLALGYALLASVPALSTLSTRSLGSTLSTEAAPVADTLAPISASLICLGTMLLSYVFWYAYKHAQNAVGEQASTAVGAYGILVIAGLVALVSLLLQLVGAALVSAIGWPGWREYSPFSFLAPMGICFLASMGLAVGARVTSWRPTRNPNAPGSRLGPPGAGARFVLRVVVMLLASNSWLLVCVEFYAVAKIQLQTDLLGGNLPVQALTAALGGMSGFLLIAALSEMTNLAHAPVRETL